MSQNLSSAAMVIGALRVKINLVHVHCLILFPDGTENLKGRVHRLHVDVTEVGSERSMSTSGQYLQVQHIVQ